MSKAIHEHAATGFSRSVDEYDRGRPEYPLEAVEYLIKELGLEKGKVVVDLGSGTGKLTKLIATSGAKVIGVEPVSKMREKFSTLLPSVTVLDGSAEAIPLPDQSADAVVVGQAFHWFNGEQALNEIHRILKPNGRLGLLWNVRDEQVDWVARLTDLIDPYERGAPRYKGGKWMSAFRSTNCFSSLEKLEFKYVQVGDREMISDRVGSISFIASLESSERERVLMRAAEIVDKHLQESRSDLVQLPYRTDVYLCQRRELLKTQ